MRGRWKMLAQRQYVVSVYSARSCMRGRWRCSLRRYISISIPGTCVNHIINPHRVFPTTQKKEVLLWCWGWLGLVIWSFGWAGRMVDMPGVPDERAGVYNRVGCWAGVGRHWQIHVNNAKSGGRVVRSLLGLLGGILGGKLYILGVAGFIMPIWDVLALQGEREAGERLYGAKFVELSKLGKRCQLASSGSVLLLGLLGLVFYT